MNDYYYVIMAVVVLAGIVFKAGQDLAGLRGDVKHVTEKLDKMADIPTRVSLLEEYFRPPTKKRQPRTR